MAKVYSLEGVRPVIDESAFVHDTAVIIGDVVIGPKCYIGPGASIRGDLGRLTIGEGANVQDNCVIHCFPGAEATIEDWGHIGIGAILHGCIIKRNALVGMNTVVMDGAIIGDSAIVAAQSFVKAGDEIPARSLAAGTPAKIIRDLKDSEIEWKEKGTLEYQKIAARCLGDLEPCEPLRALEEARPALQVESHDPLHIAKTKTD